MKANCKLISASLVAVLALCFIITGNSLADKILIPMDQTQTNHLKAYGLVYEILSLGNNVEWLLNYRAGSFMLDNLTGFSELANHFEVSWEYVSDPQAVYQTIDENNMEVILLEKAPKIAFYSPPTADPWDDAVHMALDYAEIPYTIVWDPDILNDCLAQYDWLHLHHEDFTGQYGRFYASYSGQPWYQQQVATEEMTAKALGFSKVSQMKGAVAKKIREFVENGGFLFAMCSATDTLDIALAAEGLDICDTYYDYDGMTPGYNDKLDYSQTLAFTDFKCNPNTLEYEHGDIDTPRSIQPGIYGQGPAYFTLFQFSAKQDPIPTLLTQDHVDSLPEFMGQTTAFQLDKIKKDVIILARMDGVDEAKYIFGTRGAGCFTFFAGHDPEDFQHLVGEEPTNLAEHPHSPGYRLILNNILFPAAKQSEMKT